MKSVFYFPLAIQQEAASNQQQNKSSGSSSTWSTTWSGISQLLDLNCCCTCSAPVEKSSARRALPVEFVVVRWEHCGVSNTAKQKHGVSTAPLNCSASYERWYYYVPLGFVSCTVTSEAAAHDSTVMLCGVDTRVCQTQIGDEWHLHLCFQIYSLVL